MEMTQEMFEEMAGGIAKNGFGGMIEALVSAKICAELHENAKKALARFEQMQGARLDPEQREQFIVTFVFKATKENMMRAFKDIVEDDEEDSDEGCDGNCSCSNGCSKNSCDSGTTVDQARDILASILGKVAE